MRERKIIIKIRRKKTPPCLMSRTFSGMVALFGTLGSAVLPIKYTHQPNTKETPNFCFFLIRLTELLIPFNFCFFFAGSSSAFDTAILILSAGIIIRHLAANILWNRWKLDCLPDQCALHRVQKQEGERER